MLKVIIGPAGRRVGVLGVSRDDRDARVRVDAAYPSVIDYFIAYVTDVAKRMPAEYNALAAFLGRRRGALWFYYMSSCVFFMGNDGIKLAALSYMAGVN
jgi:hypothetical protein